MTTRGRAAAVVQSQSQADTVDRVLVIACAVVWLVVLGAGVAAAVALVDLGRGHPGDASGTSTDPDSPWLLYAVIGVSAAVIALAIPLLLRARRAAAEPPRVVSRPQPRRAADSDPPDYPGPTPARYSASVISAADLDRMWLRCGIGVLTATGAAMAAVAAATYLMAVDMAGAAWAAYVVAGMITLGMIAIPVLYLRQLRDALAAEDVASAPSRPE